MKSTTSLILALAIAAVSGSAGFFIGRGSKTEAASTGSAGKPSDSPFHSQRPARAVMEKTALRDLRASLDRENDPLLRFNLALKNLEAWMNSDPKGALDWLHAQPRSGRREEIIRRALGQFAETDPKGAAEWAMAHLSGAELNNNLILIADQWARLDGSAAASWLQSLQPSNERDAAMENMFFTWASQDPTGALDFISKNPGDQDLATQLRYAAFAGWAKSDPLNAVAASLESSRQFQDPGQFASTLANWATVDLAASSDWLLTHLPDGPERTASIGQLATVFAQQSPDAGLTWIGKLKAGAERETALNQFVSEWAPGDPAAAAKWSVTQKLGTLHEEAVSQILHNFLARDETAYHQWRASLPPGPMKSQAEQLATRTNDGEGD